MIKIAITAFCTLWVLQLNAQTLSETFELRYFTDDVKANGETDFKGETEYFKDPEERIDFLRIFGNYAKAYFNDPNLNTELVPDSEVVRQLGRIKPQPLPEFRRRIQLEEWKWVGYNEKKRNDRGFPFNDGELLISQGSLHLEADKTPLMVSLNPQFWRSTLEWKVQPKYNDQKIEFSVSEAGKVSLIDVGFTADGAFFYSTGNKEVKLGSYKAKKWYVLKLEIDFHDDTNRYNFFINDSLVADYVPIGGESVAMYDKLVVNTQQDIQLDYMKGIGYYMTGKPNRPYGIHTYLNEDFEEPLNLSGWTRINYNDSCWVNDNLPISVGGEQMQGQDLYLRKEVFIDDYERAILNTEVIDPSGEIWINGEIVHLVTDRYPLEVDISKFLKKHHKNIIAIKVNGNYLTPEVGYFQGHSALDKNIGCFAGRMYIDLIGSVNIHKAFFQTEDINHEAHVRTIFQIDNRQLTSFSGYVKITLTPWFPKELPEESTTISVPVTIDQGIKQFSASMSIKQARLWSPETPDLYKIHVQLFNNENKLVDDYIFTSGIRRVSQEGGTFRLNNKPSLLKGAQIMGFRPPLHNMMKNLRCGTEEWLIKELLMVKKMNGNFIRVHVHGWKAPSLNINDPRLAEYADQIGIMLAWGTPSWIRSGDGWGHIDFEGFPKYIRQVHQHPSIVVWEAANHINSLKGAPVSEANIYCENVYQTIYGADSTRLISLMSHAGDQLPYQNDLGTLDKNGNKISPAGAWTAPNVIRGRHDHPTGYGASWSVLRKVPDSQQISFLNSPERAYFNFEHQESMGQPNWNLFKGKPWYKIMGYEWEYDKGSIGRLLTPEEWLESQAWQAFSAWEAIKKQRYLGWDGFSWCCLHGGANTVTYKKPLIDFYGHPKLAFYANKMAFQNTIAGSNNVDVVYGPDDKIQPVIISLGDKRNVNLEISIKTSKGEKVYTKLYNNIEIPEGRETTSLKGFTVDGLPMGYYFIHYKLVEL